MSEPGATARRRRSRRAAPQPSRVRRPLIAIASVILVITPISWILLHEPQSDQADASVPYVTRDDDTYITASTDPVVDTTDAPPTAVPSTPPTPGQTPTTPGVTPTLTPGQREAELLADNLCNLVALLTAREGAEHRASQERVTDLDRMLAFLRRHLGDAGLSPQMLADHMRLSVRTVHKRFEQAGMTFRHWLLEQRLDACRRALADPRCATMTVAQIAFGLGFNDLSHFTKSFRARFGTPPGRFRIDRRGQD